MSGMDHKKYMDEKKAADKREAKRHRKDLEKKAANEKKAIRLRKDAEKKEALERYKAMDTLKSGLSQVSNQIPQSQPSLSSQDFPALPTRGKPGATDPPQVTENTSSASASLWAANPVRSPPRRGRVENEAFLKTMVPLGPKAMTPMSTPEAKLERSCRGMGDTTTVPTAPRAMREGSGKGSIEFAPTAPRAMREGRGRGNINFIPAAPRAMREGRGRGNINFIPAAPRTMREGRGKRNTKFVPAAPRAMGAEPVRGSENTNSLPAGANTNPDWKLYWNVYLFRAVCLIQDIFVGFRMSTSPFVPTEVEEIDGELCFATYRYPYDKAALYWDLNAYHQVTGAEREAIACLCNSYWILATLEPIISLCLQDGCASLETCSIVPTDGPRPTVETCIGQEQEFRAVEDKGHIVIKATLHDNTCFGIDLTSAQYGWQDVLLPWEAFSVERIKSSLAPLPLKDIRRRWDARNPITKAMKNGKCAELIRNAERKLVDVAMSSMMDWLSMRKLNMLQFLTLLDPYYDTCAEDLFHQCMASMVTAVDELEVGGEFTKGYMEDLPSFPPRSPSPPPPPPPRTMYHDPFSWEELMP